MKKWVLALVSVAAFVSAQGAQEEGQLEGQFEGKVVVEWLDDPFVSKMKIVDSFSFKQAKGKVWVVPQGQVLEGKGLPPLFRVHVGQPFDAGFRKSSLVYDSATMRMKEPWSEAQRMFYEASVTEGVFPQDAKVMYLVLATQGSRWETSGSHCFGSCHGATLPLEWRPVVDEAKINELIAWVRNSDPSLEEIDTRAQDAIRAQGPHIFTMPACNMFSGSTKVKHSCD